MTILSRRSLLLAPMILAPAISALASEARRVVSVGGALTEILYRIGLEGDIVGVDSTSQFPPEALKSHANLGYLRSLGAEGILSLGPTIVLAAEGAGPPDTLRLVEQTGVRIVRFPDEPSPTGISGRVELLAKVMGVPEKGAALIAEIEREFTDLSLARSDVKHSTRTLFVLSLQNGRPLVGGRGTPADAILALAGATNAASSLEGWKPMSDESVIAAAPEAIVMMEQGPGGKAQDPFGLPAFAATPAAAQRRFVVMDGLYLLGFGPRTPAAARELLQALHWQDKTGAKP